MRISDGSSDVCSSDLGVGLGHDVDRRAGELRGETNILAAAADGEAELIVGNNHFDPVLLLVDDDAGDRRRLKRVDYEGGEVLRPGDDVDLLALHFLDDRLDAAALHADAGADRVDRAVVADDADLGAARSEEHTSELQSLMRISYAVLCLKK